MNRLIGIFLIFSLTVIPALADYKITQKRTIEGVGQETTVYSKGVRERSETKMVMDGDAEQSAMMARMMPNVGHISQCDLKQDISVNDAKRLYFIDYYDWSALTPEQKTRRPNQKVTIKGTSTVSSTIVDSGKRQQMFGMTAKWLKHVQSIDTSADSCDGRSSIRIEEEGWFVDLVLSSESCQAPIQMGSTGGCRPRMIIKAAQNPGFFLTGTTKMYQDNKLETTSELETTALSKATLDQALFEVPKSYTEVDSLVELTKMNMSFDPSAMGSPSKPSSSIPTPSAPPVSAKKLVAIDFLTGNTSKVDQSSLRNYIASKVSESGMAGIPVNSAAELAGGTFSNVIAVEIRKVKESSGAKIGGLFGKVTGSDDAAKLGDTEAEIAINIFAKDGKTVVVGGSTLVKVKGKGDDALKAAVDKILGGLLEKIR